MLHVGDARQPVRQLRKIRNPARSFQFAAPREVFHQRDDVNRLLLFSQLHHALKNLPVLRQKEIVRAHFLDRGVQRVVIQQNRAENAALCLQIVR